MNQAVGFESRAAEVGTWLAERPLIRTINFHKTARASAESLQRQLAQSVRESGGDYKFHYRPCGP